MATAEPISHIESVTTPAIDGLWALVHWQGQDGAWHDVEGWRGSLVAGSPHWAVLEQNFGEGPFHWVLYAAPAGPVHGGSQVFCLPAASGKRLVVPVVLAP